MWRIASIWAILLTVAACSDDDIMDPGDLSDIPYDPHPYEVPVPEGFPQLEVPANNPMTVEGVFLGRRLFFDPILSRDSSMSCSSCHLQAGSFTDNLALSEGIDGLSGRRSAMSLLNVGLYYRGLFWDGRSPTLEDQALEPVEDPVELHAMWPEVVERLKNHESYPADFRKAFGIQNTSNITRHHVAMAIAQFERTLVSSGNSKYDRYVRGEVFLTDSEFNGYQMFFDASDGLLPDAECAHCHAPPLFTINEYRNNGIEDVSSVFDLPDLGFGEVTGDTTDYGKFRIPTLRNIEYTAPYMHDGRFETLQEVLEHYNSGGHRISNTDPLIYPLNLTDQQKADLLAFIHTLRDTTFLQSEQFGNPF